MLHKKKQPGSLLRQSGLVDVRSWRSTGAQRPKSAPVYAFALCALRLRRFTRLARCLQKCSGKLSASRMKSVASAEREERLLAALLVLLLCGVRPVRPVPALAISSEPGTARCMKSFGFAGKALLIRAGAKAVYRLHPEQIQSSGSEPMAHLGTSAHNAAASLRPVPPAAVTDRFQAGTVQTKR